MTGHNCQIKAQTFGKDRYGKQRYRCLKCGKTFQAFRKKLLGDMYLEEDKALLILKMLVGGSSIRSIERITGIEKKTILSLLNRAGERCEDLTKRYMRKVKCSDLQFDEIWTFCHMKEKAKKRQRITSNGKGKLVFEHDKPNFDR